MRGKVETVLSASSSASSLSKRSGLEGFSSFSVTKKLNQETKQPFKEQNKFSSKSDYN